MEVSEELLVAYVDGELTAEARAEFERQLAGDAVLARRVAAQRVLGERLRAAYAPALDEPVPERLRQLLEPPATTTVDLAAARSARAGGRTRWGSREWGAMAACLVAGLLLAHWHPFGGHLGLVENRDGLLVAHADLARALSGQASASAVPGSRIAIGLSFRDRSGEYCRTFMTGGGMDLAGVACREGDYWRLDTVVRAGEPSDGDYRRAAASLPPAVLAAVDAAIDGEPLDAVAEREALQRGWR